MKKIDVEKSTILGTKEGDTDDLKLGISGYFSHYRDFKTYVEGNLDGFTRTDFMSIQEDPDGDYGNQWYDYFIPADRVVFIEEEKKLRPFKNVEEFVSVTRCGSLGSSILRYRHNSEHRERVMVFIGYTDDNRVILGGAVYSLTNLFEDYEYYDNDYQEWKPFGVEE